MMIYATSAELTTWGVTPPTNADALLRSASILVHRATMTAVYDVDPATSLPTDADKVAALRDATCSQVGTWIALAIDPATGGAAAAGKVVSAKSIGSGSITYAVTDAARALADAATSLSSEALLILADAGLTGSPWEF